MTFKGVRLYELESCLKKAVCRWREKASSSEAHYALMRRVEIGAEEVIATGSAKTIELFMAQLSVLYLELHE